MRRHAYPHPKSRGPLASSVLATLLQRVTREGPEAREPAPLELLRGAQRGP